MSDTIKIIYVEWMDAISDDSRWVSVDESIHWGSDNDWIIKQTGFLIKETKDFILIANRINPHPQSNTETMVRGLMKIPIKTIKKRIDLSKNIK